MTAADRQLFWMGVFDPSTGLATRPVGAVGVQDGQWWVSWLPYVERVGWRPRVAGLVEVSDPVSEIEGWMSACDGIGWALLAVEDPPPAVDLAGAVEGCVDRLLDVGRRAAEEA